MAIVIDDQANSIDELSEMKSAQEEMIGNLRKTIDFHLKVEDGLK